MRGQYLGRARVSQDPLQGLCLAPLSCLCCLGNTHLQPPNLLPQTGPINGFPVQRRRGEKRIHLECFRGRCFLSFSLEPFSGSLATVAHAGGAISSALPPPSAVSLPPLFPPPTP